jgi:hypothetical protein
MGTLSDLAGKSAHGVGLSTELVGILRAYDKSLPVDFLASLLKRTKAEIYDDLRALEQRKVVRLEGEYVKLLKNLEQ